MSEKIGVEINTCTDLIKFEAGGLKAISGLNVDTGKCTDLIKVEAEGLKARTGLNVDTGASISNDGVEAKVAGLDLRVGKVTGLSTPLGEFESNHI
ncbi:unnamed protein product [Rhizophagus irregularis]|nr:unnamed protein product [Rhizophagus irregularis]